jgi:hypothetical protein
MTVDGKRVSLNRVKSTSFYIRSGWMAINTLDTVGDGATIELPGSELDRKELGNVTLTMDGYAAAYAKLRPRCFGQISDQRTESSPSQLPQSKAAPPAASAAAVKTSAPASGKDSETLELTRVATAEQKLQLDFIHYIFPDCKSVGPVTVRVLEQPQHGVLSIEYGQAFTDFPADDKRAACNARESKGTLVFYQPNADYRGADSITVSALSESGHALTRHYSIEVK